MIAQRPIERFNSENLKPLAIWIFVASLLKYGSRRTLLTSENRRSDFNEHNQRNRRATKHKRRNVVEGQTHHVISSVRPTMTRCRGSDPPRHFKGQTHHDTLSRVRPTASFQGPDPPWHVVKGQTQHVISRLRPTVTRRRGSDPPCHFKGPADPPWHVIEGQTQHVISRLRPTMTRRRGSDPPRHFKGHADPQSRANTSLSRHVGPCSPVLDVHTAPNGTSSALNLQAAQSLQRDRATPYGSRNRVNCCT